MKKRFGLFQIGTIINMFVCYTCMYFCYSCLSVTSVDIIKDKIIDAQQYGYIVSAAKIAKVIPTLLSGTIVDMSSGIFWFSLGEVMCGIFTILFGLASYFNNSNLRLVIFIILNSSFSMASCFPWAGVVKLESNWFSYLDIGKAVGFMSLSYLFGDSICRGVLSLFLLAKIRWNFIFVISGSILSVVGIWSFLSIRNSPKSYGFPLPESHPSAIQDIDVENILNLNEDEKKQKNTKIKIVSVKTYFCDVLLPILKEIKLWLLQIWYFYPNIIRYQFFDFLSIYLAQYYNFSGSIAGFLSMIYPLFGGIGSLWMGRIFDRTKDSERKKYYLFILCEVLLSLLLLLFLKFHYLGRHFSVDNIDDWRVVLHFVIIFALISGVGFLSIGQYAISNTFSIYIGGQHGCSTISSIFDGVSALSAFLSNYLVGYLLKKYGLILGWDLIWIIFTSLSVVPLVVTIILILLPQKKSKK